MVVDYRLIQPSAQPGAWNPILSLIDRLLRELGILPSPTSPFVITAHTNRRSAPASALHVMQMHLAGLYSVDPLGWGVEHSAYSSREWEAEPLTPASEFCAHLAHGYMTSGGSKIAQPPLAAPSESGYVLVPLQLADDCVITQHSPVSVRDFVQRVAEWSRDTGTRVLMKLHPGTKSRCPEVADYAVEAAALSPNLHLTAGNIHSLIHAAKAVLVLNSGVGFEALIHGKPVITLGRCDYSQVTVAGNLSTLSENLEQAMEKASDDGYRFVRHYLLSRCYWLVSDPHAENRLKAYLADRLAQF